MHFSAFIAFAVIRYNIIDLHAVKSRILIFCCSASSVKVSGKEFRPGAVVCITPPSDSDYPLFGEIVRVFVSDGTKQFLINLYKTVLFSFTSMPTE